MLQKRVTWPLQECLGTSAPWSWSPPQAPPVAPLKATLSLSLSGPMGLASWLGAAGLDTEWRKERAAEARVARDRAESARVGLSCPPPPLVGDHMSEVCASVGFRAGATLPDTPPANIDVSSHGEIRGLSSQVPTEEGSKHSSPVHSATSGRVPGSPFPSPVHSLYPSFPNREYMQVGILAANISRSVTTAQPSPDHEHLLTQTTSEKEVQSHTAKKGSNSGSRISVH